MGDEIEELFYKLRNILNKCAIGDDGRNLLERASNYLLGERIKVANESEKNIFEHNLGLSPISFQDPVLISHLLQFPYPI